MSETQSHNMTLLSHNDLGGFGGVGFLNGHVVQTTPLLRCVHSWDDGTRHEELDVLEAPQEEEERRSLSASLVKARILGLDTSSNVKPRTVFSSNGMGYTLDVPSPLSVQ